MDSDDLTGHSESEIHLPPVKVGHIFAPYSSLLTPETGCYSNILGTGDGIAVILPEWNRAVLLCEVRRLEGKFIFESEQLKCFMRCM